MALDLRNPFDLTVSQAVLAIESNDGRFETFCRDAVSAIEGDAIIFSTSKSWDLGRDGVGAGGARGIYVCTSLRDDIDLKTLEDLQRITSTTTRIRHIYFCSSQKLSEHRRSQLEGQLAAEIDYAFEVTCLGSTQLTEAASREPGLFEKYYDAEVHGALRAISPDPSDDTEETGLRLALIACAGDNSVEIRNELYAAGLLEALSDGEERTLAVCSKVLSEHLHLGHVISEAAVLPHLQRLLAADLVSKTDVVYKISEAGLERVKQQRLGAAERFLVGRADIRTAIEQSIGENLSEDDYRRIWSVFESRIASYFHGRGTQMVAEISALLEENAPSSRKSELKSPLFFIDELATAVSNTSTHPQRRIELHTAVTDLFTDRASGATEWLVRVCASYVALCALGLEHDSSAALTKLFARTALALDSDVALSLLGEGEPEHQSVFTIVTKWIRVGGKVLIAEPVLEEVSYHASIADNDFRQVLHLLPGTATDRLRIIENVFVRSFAEHMANGHASLSHWRRFIGQFLGRVPHDWGNVLSHLKAEYSVEKLPVQPSEFAGLESRVRAFLTREAEAQGLTGKIVRDKATRDGRLYAAMVSYQRAIKATDPGATCLLVSSAHRLMKAEQEFNESGEQEFVVQISTVLGLLSLLPQVSLGLSAMKAFLFEDRRSGFSSDLERTILRIVRSSRAVSLPWAKRGVLMKELRDSLISDAKQQGIRVRSDDSAYALERLALSDANRDRTIELLSGALDKVAVPTSIEDENSRLKKENEQLKRLLEERRTRDTHARRGQSGGK